MADLAQNFYVLALKRSMKSSPHFDLYFGNCHLFRLSVKNPTLSWVQLLHSILNPLIHKHIGIYQDEIHQFTEQWMKIVLSKHAQKQFGVNLMPFIFNTCVFNPASIWQTGGWDFAWWRPALEKGILPTFVTLCHPHAGSSQLTCTLCCYQGGIDFKVRLPKEASQYVESWLWKQPWRVSNFILGHS